MQSTDGGLEHRKPGFSGCVVRSSPKQSGAEFTILGQCKTALITSIKTSRQNTAVPVSATAYSEQLRDTYAFAEKAISRRPSPLAPALVRATRTLMTPHCSQTTKADAKGKRRRGETKAWHAHRWAHPPRRRRRQGHQRESRVGG